MGRCAWILGLVLFACDAQPPSPDPEAPIGVAPVGVVAEPAVPHVDRVPKRPVIAPPVIIVLTPSGVATPGDASVAWDDAFTLIGDRLDRQRQLAVAESRAPDLRLEIVADPQLDMTRISEVVQVASNLGFEEATLAVQTDQARTRLAIALPKMCRAVALDRSPTPGSDPRCATRATFVTERGAFEHIVVGMPSHCDPALAQAVLRGEPAWIATVRVPDGRCPRANRPIVDECPYVFAGAGAGVTWGSFAPTLASIAFDSQRDVVLTPIAVGSLGCDEGGAGEELGLVGTVRAEPPSADAISLEDVGRPLAKLPDVRLDKPDVEGAIEADFIEKLVAVHLREVRECYRTALEEDPKVRDRVTIGFAIDTGGLVSEAAPIGAPKDDDLGACIARRVEHWKFPKPADGTPVRVRCRFRLVATGS